MFNRIIRFATSLPKSVIAALGDRRARASARSRQARLQGHHRRHRAFLPKSSESAQARTYGETALRPQKGAPHRHRARQARRRPNAHRRRSRRGPRARRRDAALRRSTPPAAQGPAERPPRARRRDRRRAGRPRRADGRFALVGLPVAGQHHGSGRPGLLPPGPRPRRRRRPATTASRSASPAGSRDADEMKASEGTQALAQVLLFGAVVLLSLLFFRGPLAAVVPLVAIFVVASAASGMVVLAALRVRVQARRRHAAADHRRPRRHRHRLLPVPAVPGARAAARRRGPPHRRANAAGAVGPVIASAALASSRRSRRSGSPQFGQFRVLGPSIAISVLVMLLAGITLMPAIAAVTGRALFWPSRSLAAERTDGPAARLGRGSPARRAASRSPSSRCSSSSRRRGRHEDGLRPRRRSLDGRHAGPPTRSPRRCSAARRDPLHVYVTPRPAR